MRALIAGLGLIGGSIGMALRARSWRVAYVDPHVAIDDARRAGAADEAGPQAADLVIVATPVDVARRELDTLANYGLATTVCSVLRPFDRAGVVAGHPLAGSQEHGLAAARADLFEGKRWFVTRREALVDRMIDACGARCEVVDAEEHDRAVALTSHLPQILSTALAAAIDPELLRFAGPGLQTFLRLAGSDASVWAPVVEANRDHLADAAARVSELVQAILGGDSDAFAKARDLYARLSSAPQ
ncbi:MAG TPA: prephenate dehydrogenase/arogenate dehydrogenase family protein [Thermoanaerobaculia bacterium]|nr:prephenate dehydrogenase/arogenate dehydrogenase family protein [Thermoanaerobaculia bacterium]